MSKSNKPNYVVESNSLTGEHHVVLKSELSYPVCICSYRENAELIAKIMESDAEDKIFNSDYGIEVSSFVNDNIVGYLDHKYRTKVMSFNYDDESMPKITLGGRGRISRFTPEELNHIQKIKGAPRLQVSRKVGNVTLWKVIFY